MKSKLEAAGIQDAKTERMPWGTYWHTETGGFREGHFDKDGKAFEWPFDSETRTSGKPVPMKVPNVEVQRDSGSIIAGGSAGTTGSASQPPCHERRLLETKT